MLPLTPKVPATESFAGRRTSFGFGAIAAGLVIATLVGALAVLWRRNAETRAELARATASLRESQAEQARLAERLNQGPAVPAVTPPVAVTPAPSPSTSPPTEAGTEAARVAERNSELRADLARAAGRSNALQGEIASLPNRNNELQGELARFTSRDNERQAEITRLTNLNRETQTQLDTRESQPRLQAESLASPSHKNAKQGVGAHDAGQRMQSESRV